MVRNWCCTWVFKVLNLPVWCWGNWSMNSSKERQETKAAASLFCIHSEILGTLNTCTIKYLLNVFFKARVIISSLQFLTCSNKSRWGALPARPQDSRAFLWPRLMLPRSFCSTRSAFYHGQRLARPPYRDCSSRSAQMRSYSSVSCLAPGSAHMAFCRLWGGPENGQPPALGSATSHQCLSSLLRKSTILCD